MDRNASCPVEFAIVISYVSASYSGIGPDQNDGHFVDYFIKCIFFNENLWIFSKFCFWRPTWHVRIGPCNGFPLSRRQAMKWTNDENDSHVHGLLNTCVTGPRWVIRRYGNGLKNLLYLPCIVEKSRNHFSNRNNVSNVFKCKSINTALFEVTELIGPPLRRIWQ